MIIFLSFIGYMVFLDCAVKEYRKFFPWSILVLIFLVISTTLSDIYKENITVNLQKERAEERGLMTEDMEYILRGNPSAHKQWILDQLK